MSESVKGSNNCTKWEPVTLKNELAIRHGYAFEGEHFSDKPPGEVLLVPGNFHRDGGLYFTENNTKYFRGTVPPHTRLEKGDLVVVMTDLSPRTLILGRFAEIRVPFGVLHNQRIGLVEVKNEKRWCRRYLAYALNEHRIRNEVILGATGTTVRHTSPDRILSNSAIRPPVEEQRKIARILTTLDSLIEKTEALIAKYQSIKQGMMHDLFTRGVDSHGHLRPTPEQAPELYKPSELGLIPKEWDALPLDHFLSYISYGFTNPMPETVDGPWMVTAANVLGGRIQYQSCRHTSQTAYDTFLTNKSKPNVGDILLTKDGTLGRLAIVDRSDICINQSVAVLRPKDDVNANFLKHLLETPFFQKKMLDDAGGSTIKHIYITIVNKMLIPKPSPHEQGAVSNIANNLNARIAAEAANLKKLVATKSGLMQDLLTGKVRVKVDEAEEVAVDV